MIMTTNGMTLVALVLGSVAASGTVGALNDANLVTSVVESGQLTHKFPISILSAAVTRCGMSSIASGKIDIITPWVFGTGVLYEYGTACLKVVLLLLIVRVTSFTVELTPYPNLPNTCCAH